MIHLVRFEIYYHPSCEKPQVKVTPDMLFTCEYDDEDKKSYNEYLDLRGKCYKLCITLGNFYETVRLVEVSRNTLYFN